MKFINLTWKADAVFDYWSLVHISWGIVLGITLLIYTRLSLLPSLIVAIFLMLVWEYFEKSVGLGEGYANVVSDVFIGIVGFVLGYILLGNLESYKLILGIVVSFMVILEIIGWYFGYIKN